MGIENEWEEVKRLAADFQKAQLSSTLQRLSDRNCIEIVTKLIEANLLDVVFTCDGKEYVTPQQLIREIKDEIYVRGGRINLVELAKEVNVDLGVVNSKAHEICNSDKRIRLILGQLIDETYVVKIAKEINEKLIQVGQINVSDLTSTYDLPAEFLQQSVLEKYLGKLIFARQDPENSQIFFTEAFVSRSRAKIRGALAAITRPTPITAIINQCDISDRLFFTFMKEISLSGTLTSKQTSAQYIPFAYSKIQVEMVLNSHKQNGYLEYDSLVNLGITDPKPFIKRVLPNEELIFLKSCAISNQLIEQVNTLIEECHQSKSFVDVSSFLPSVLSQGDTDDIIKKAITPALQKTLQVFGSTVLSVNYVEGLASACYVFGNDKAKACVDSGAYQKYLGDKMSASSKLIDDSSYPENKSDKREERRKKAAGGKAGGGAQGRETKTKSVKKHQRSKQNTADSDSDDENTYSKSASSRSLELVTLKDIKKCLLPLLKEDEIEYLLDDLAEYLLPLVNKSALNTAGTLFETTLENTNQSRRQTHASIQDKLNILINDIKHYDKGIKMFPADQQSTFVKYYLKTIGTDIVSEFFKYAGTECGLQISENTLTSEQRTKLLNDMTDEYKSFLIKLNKSLNEQTLDEFYDACESCLNGCSMVLKKVDKKKDRSLFLTHKFTLLQQLEKCDDPALVLHLAVLIMFISATKTMLHASGRHVSTILSFLKPSFTDDQKQELTSYHDNVLKLLTLQEENDDRNEVVNLLTDKMSIIKQIATEFKKGNGGGD